MIQHAARRRGRWRRLVVLAAACGVIVPLTGHAAKGPVAVSEEFCRFFDQRYAFFDLRGVDWPQQKAAYRPRVTAATTDDELFAIFCGMIDPLDDHHTSVSRGSSKCFADDVPAWHARSGEIQRFIQHKYLKTPATIVGAITYGLIDEATGYIDIRHMGCKSGSEIDTALAEKFTLPDGKVYEKIGLPPHQLIPFRGDVIEQGRDELLEAALAR